MFEDVPGTWALAGAGFLVGATAGYFVRRARLCSFGALEDAFVGGDMRRLRAFALALAAALLGTEALLAAGIFAPEATRYAAPVLPWLAVPFGGLLFGLGMALTGTCAFGSLVRAGSGDLRSVVILLVLGAAAYAVWRGALSPLRMQTLESAVLILPPPGRADLPALLEHFLGTGVRHWLTPLLAAGLLLFALANREIWRTPRLMTAGVVLGLAVAAGWLATAVLADPFAEKPVPPHSLTFVGPIAEALFGVTAGIAGLVSFGAASTVGAAAGAAIAALRADEFRWEAFDDPREMKRQLVGAAFMGAGGVLCGGCTIGQGLTAGSLLALSWPLAMAGIAAGARLGIAILIEGSVAGVLRLSPPR